MSQTHVVNQRIDYGRWGSVAILLAAMVGGSLTYPIWLPLLQRLLIKQVAEDAHGTAAHQTAATPADEHGHADHATVNVIELSKQAQRSIGLKVGQVKLASFERTVNIPGMVIERRGRSQMKIAAPLTGIVTQVFPLEGESVSPGDALFEMRLTHEELVQAQADLLKTTEELDVIRREVARLKDVAKDGAVALKSLLERQYEEQKQEASFRAQSQAMLLHGLSAEQVAEIVKTRVLLKTFVVRVPNVAKGETIAPEAMLQVQEMLVERGQQVTAGEALSVLADHTELLVEGEAFEQDARFISQAVAENRSVTAVLEEKGREPTLIEDLKIQYLANRVQPASRTQHFYVLLPNKLLRDTGREEEHRFVEWRYKPGQRMQLRVPVEQWTDRIVLPIDAVAQDGIEHYVFRVNGDLFEQQPVHVEHRDSLYAVIANDGSLFPGDAVALNGAQQMQLALKNKSGGGIDPHAGHNH